MIYVTGCWQKRHLNSPRETQTMILNWFQPVPRIHDLDPFSGVTNVVPLRASAGGFPPLNTSVMGHFVLGGTQTMILNWFQPVPRKHDLDPFSRSL